MTRTGPIRTVRSGSETSYDFEVVLVSYHSRGEIEGLLGGLPTDLPVVIVDNAKNADDLRGFAARRPHTRYLDSGGGQGFARAANQGVRASSQDVVVLVNPDTRPTIDTLTAIVADVRSDPQVVSSSPMNVGRSGDPEFGSAGWEPTFRRAFVHAFALHKLFPNTGVWAKPTPGRAMHLGWVSGSCMAVARIPFLGIGGFDERYYVYNEDMAFGRSAREHGLQQRLRTDLTVPHAVGGSGAPSSEMLRLRGSSMRRYLLHHHAKASAVLMADLIGVGFVIRTAVFGLLGKRDKAQQDAAYVRGIFTGRATVGGEVVTNRG